MKFEKFVKTLASSGIIYERGIFRERWLASPSALMLIPIGTRSVTGIAIQEMPEAIDKMIGQVGCTEPVLLRKAVMPFADGKIKDCVRVFANDATDVHIAISNDDWSLIEKSDYTEALYVYEDEKPVSKALLVKKYPQFPEDDMELVGIIFPTEYAEQLNFTTIKEDMKKG